MTLSSVVLRPQKVSFGRRDLREVPFVELFQYNIQGVVSSGSDTSRVYVAVFGEGPSGLRYSCTTNLNRPCGGLRGGPCKHLRALIEEAIAQYGPQALADCLDMPAGAQVRSSYDILGLPATLERLAPGIVFSRFCDQIGLLQLPALLEAAPELAFFPM